MPGKVNPVMCEMMIQACHYANGMMLTVLLGAKNGELQVNTAMVVTVYAIIESLNLLASCINDFSRHCLKNIRPNTEILDRNTRKSLMLITAIAPKIGHGPAVDIAMEALSSGQTIPEILKRKNIMAIAEIDAACDPRNMANPNIS
jgi:fumarate hydratase class II